MVDVFIGIGSNIEPQKNVSMTLELLRLKFPSIVFSRVFESEAVGFNGDNFFNLVAKFEVKDLDANRSGLSDLVAKYSSSVDQLVFLVSQLKEVENQLGRKRGDKKFSARNIDIDVLLFGDLQIEKPVELPRGEILKNAYVLWPLSELAPDLKHPGSDKTYAEYWRKFDKSIQRLEPVE